MSFVGQLIIELSRNIKSREKIKKESDLLENLKARCIQLINAIPKFWKEFISEDKGNSNNFDIYDYNLIEQT